MFNRLTIIPAKPQPTASVASAPCEKCKMLLVAFVVVVVILILK